MNPGQIELFRSARQTILRLQTATAKEVRKAYGELFHVDPKSTRGTPPALLVEEIAEELQERCLRGARVERSRA